MADAVARHLTVGEVQGRLRFAKPDPVYALISSGALKASNVSPSAGRPCWRIDPGDLEEFLRSRRSAPTPKVERQARTRRPKVTAYF